MALAKIVTELEKLQLQQRPRSRLYPPATAKQIASAEARLGFRFPASYRAFLLLHDGWRGFWGDLDLFGVSGPGHTRPARAFAAQTKIIGAMLKDAVRSDARYLEKLARDRSRIDVREQVPLGADRDGNLLVFERKRQKRGGECPIVFVEDDGEYVAARFPSFLALVKHAVSIAKRQAVSAPTRARGGPVVDVYSWMPPDPPMKQVLEVLRARKIAFTIHDLDRGKKLEDLEERVGKKWGAGLKVPMFGVGEKLFARFDEKKLRAAIAGK